MLLRVEVVQFQLAPLVRQAGYDNHTSLGTGGLGRLDQQRSQKVAQKKMTKVVAGHVQLQVVLCHILRGHSQAGIENENVQPSRAEAGLVVPHLPPYTHAVKLDNLLSVFRICSANCLTDFMEARSTRRKTTLPLPVDSAMLLHASWPRSMFLQARITRAPLRARSRAVSRPMPAMEEYDHPLDGRG